MNKKSFDESGNNLYIYHILSLYYTLRVRYHCNCQVVCLHFNTKQQPLKTRPKQSSRIIVEQHRTQSTHIYHCYSQMFNSNRLMLPSILNVSQETSRYVCI